MNSTLGSVVPLAMFISSSVQWNKTPEGWKRNLRCGGAVQDLVQLPDVAEEEVWGDQLARFVQEALRRRVRAPRWGWGDQGGEENIGVVAIDPVAPNDEEQEVIERDRRNALGVSREVEREGQDTLNIPRDISNTSISRHQEGYLRDSLQPETAQVGDLSGQEERAGDGVQPDADLLQPDVQPNLDVTPVQLPITGGEGGGLDATPLQPEAEPQEDVYQAHEVPLVQEQEQNLSGAQIQEEVQVTEFSLLVSCLIVVSFLSMLLFRHRFKTWKITGRIL